MSTRGHVRRPSAAMVVACVALLVSLGGVGVAATVLPRNSVGTLQLKANAVTSAKVANGSLKRVDLAAGTLVPGPQGPQGPQGPPGAAGTGGNAPSGPAGGDLTGTYPNPLVGPKAIGSAEVIDGALTGTDLAAGSVNSKLVTDDTLTGFDINESTLGQVPSALLGGLGRTGKTEGRCDPESATLQKCAEVQLTLPIVTRVLVIAQVSADNESDASRGAGACIITTSATGLLKGSRIEFRVIEGHGSLATDAGTLVAVTPLIGPGVVFFSLVCNQGSPGAIRYALPSVTAVAISPS